MSNLKELTLKGLSVPNTKNFELDLAIIKYRNKNGILRNNTKFCKKNGINSAKLGGRVVSLINRGHLERAKPFTTIDTLKSDGRISIEVKRKILTAMAKGVRNQDLIKKFSVSLATISRLRKLVIEPKSKKVYKKINTDAFSNSNGVKKEEARETMVEAIRTSGLYGKILTLPYKYCKIERKLIDTVSNKFSFVGCETEPNVYFDMIRTVAEHRINMECSPRPIGEKIDVAHEGEYSHALLDYCGQLNTFKSDIETAMRNDIVAVGGTISITLNKRKTIGIGGNIEDEMNDLNPLGNIEGKEVENAILTFIRIVGGFKYSVETVMPYKDKGKGSMILVVVKRIK